MKIPLPVVVTEESVKNKIFFTASCPLVDIASQGKSHEEALKNIEEALELYFEDPEAKRIEFECTRVTLSNVLTTVPKEVLKKCQSSQ